MTSNPVASRVINEAPEDSYDQMKAVESKTMRNKPRSVALTDFVKQQARDEGRMNTTDAYANVKMENTREERELEIQARKE